MYGSAIHACVTAGQHARALGLLGEMLERRVVPDAAVFTAAMTAVDGWGGALRLLEVMKREVRELVPVAGRSLLLLPWSKRLWRGGTMMKRGVEGNFWTHRTFWGCTRDLAVLPHLGWGSSRSLSEALVLCRSEERVACLRERAGGHAVRRVKNDEQSVHSKACKIRQRAAFSSNGLWVGIYACSFTCRKCSFVSSANVIIWPHRV